MKAHIIGVAGNPNCGKTTLFNHLTGARQRVGNWPGVTVERKSGEYTHQGGKIDVVDLPGIYSLSAASADEAVARDYIISGEADLIVNIVDASNLERNLYLTLQLLELNVPLVVALNMMDTAKDRRIAIDILLLSERLGCPVVPLVASKGKGIDDLRRAIHQQAAEKRIPHLKVIYPPEIEKSLASLVPYLQEKGLHRKMNLRYAAVKLLEGDEWIGSLAGAQAAAARDACLQTIEDRLNEEADIVMADTRYGLIRRLTQEAVTMTTRVGKTVSDRIDRVVLNRMLGIPIFLAAMYLMFMVTINFGGAFIDIFDVAAGAVFVDGFGGILTFMGSPEWLTVLLADGIGGGLQTIATFIPPIGLMFLCLCLLEDSGYMARAAFVMDRFMRFIGLPGKAFVPMMVGFGCNVPAIMATRTLENQRDRILTIMMNPFMSCGARLPVYTLFAAAFFPVGGQNLVFGLYLLGIGFAVLTGFVLKNSLLKGDITPFVMELPPYHRPTFKGVVLRAWDRLRSFMFRAGKIIVPVVVVLSFLNSMGTDGSFGNDDSDKSALSALGKSITPVFAPMGIAEENWPATVGIFTGIFAKEAVVGTLDALYGQMDGSAGQSAGNGNFGAMVNLFDGRAGAFAYLLFILLYFPCVAATAAVYRETNLKWTAFAGAWTTGLAYMAAVIFYQAATITRNPGSSVVWIAIMCGLFIGVVMILRQIGKNGVKQRFLLKPAGSEA
jgi:ferrous iron transport protein B